MVVTYVIAPASPLSRWMEITCHPLTILSALGNLSFQTHGAEPQASFLLSVIPSSHPHLNRENVLETKKGFLMFHHQWERGKKKKKKVCTTQKVSQLWNERWNIQRGFMSLTVQCSADCSTPGSWSQLVPPPPGSQPRPALSLTLLNCYSPRLMPLIQIIKVSPIRPLKFNFNT